MNFRRILSKSSLKSSSSTTDKSLCHSEEVSKLQSEVELLKQTIESLKVSVESRDAAIGTLAREKEKLYVELKSAQRTNRNLHQQLTDERDIHHKEKNYLIEEIKRLTKNNSNSCNEFNTERNIGLCYTMMALSSEKKPLVTIGVKILYYIIKKLSTVLNIVIGKLEAESESSLKEELKSKDEVIFNICTKYLKIKSSKERLQKKIHKLQQQSQQICESVVLLLHENRRSLDSILRKLVKAAAMSPSTKSYLNLLKVNANLHYENTQLKVCLSVKDFSCEDEGESLRKESSAKKFKSQTFYRKLKFKANLHQHNYQQYLKLSNRAKILGNTEINNSIHTMFAPYFRRKRLYSSEPNVAIFLN